MTGIMAYKVPEGAVKNNDYQIRIRKPGGIWISLEAYLVRVDMHEVREASMAYFDFTGTVECEITCPGAQIEKAVLRPVSQKISYSAADNSIRFKLSKPANLSIEVNGDRFHNLHLFAGRMEGKQIEQEQDNILVMEGDPAIMTCHNMESVTRKLQDMGKGAILYFKAGTHYMEERKCYLPSDTKVYIEGGAVVMGSFIVHKKQNISIEGRGVIYLGHAEKASYLRGIELAFARHVMISGITIINPAHYSILMGSCHDIMVDNIKAFSCEGWSDGIDIMASDTVLIQNSFLRNSDDCIAIYGSRGEYRGGSQNIQVINSILWADVAHPINIGTHGDHENEGDIISRLLFDSIDILEHHEPQDDYLGCMAINAGDKNTVKKVTFQNIRVEQFERGKLFDVQIKHNVKYNPAPGQSIEDITFSDITYNGEGEFPSCIKGFDSGRLVKNIKFHNLLINGEHIRYARQGNIYIGSYAEDITFS